MRRPRICAVITRPDLRAVREAEEQADLFEVRIDLIGPEWKALARSLTKPWIATNRLAAEGGHWQESEARRQEELLKALALGAYAVDMELATPGLERLVPVVRRVAQCLISYHNPVMTPSLEALRRVVRDELSAGADICKVVTTACGFEDNLTVLSLISEFAESRVIALAMGPEGQASRLLCPLLGGELTYGAVSRGQESATGQPAVAELAQLYRMMAECP